MTTTIGSLDLGALSDLREDVTQYFWFESDSTSAWGSGAHVTLYPESQFTDPNNANYMKGQNIIMNTDGFSIRNGALPMMVLDNDSLDFNIIDTINNEYTNVASFGTVSTIGVTDNTQSYLCLDYHSMRMIDKEGNGYFEIKDLRDKNGEYDATDNFVGDGNTVSFHLTYQAINTSYTVLLNGIEVTSGVSKHDTYFYFDVSPAIGDIISVNYTTYSVLAKYYTLGVRNANGSFGAMSLAEGYDTIASGAYSHAEGYSTTASGECSHAEGSGTIASGLYSHAEGEETTASGRLSHAEGIGTIASGDYSHAEGYSTTASSLASHAEGDHTTASRAGSHAEGYETIASGYDSHAEGWYTRATGDYSHAGGRYTVANMSTQTAIGTWNIQDSTPSQAVHPNDNTSYGNYALIIGNGTSLNRSNALTVDWQGGVAFYDPSRTFIVEEYTKSYSAISSGSAFNWSEQKSKSGYYPIGVVGFRTNMQALVVNMVKLSSVQSGQCTINMNARAVANVSAGTAQMYVLWIKET